MALNIPSMQGTVQVVMTLDTLESMLTQYPHLEVFPVAHHPDDLPTYAFRVKVEPPAPRMSQQAFIPRIPRRRKSK